MAIEPRVGIAAVVKHAVQHQPHSLLLRFQPQSHQRRIAAKLRINVTVILGIIFMHARSGEYRVQVQRGNAQLFRYGNFSLMPSRSPP